MISRKIILCLVLLLLAAMPVSAQWLKGQAVTYADFGYVHSVTSSMSHVYFATSSGIIRYDRIGMSWEEPLTGADGMFDEIATRIWVDRFDDNLYAATDMGYYEHNKLFDRWYQISELPEIDQADRHLSAPDFLLPEFNANYMGGGRFVDTDGRSYTTTDIVDDNTGNLWIGTWGFGAAIARTSSGLMNFLPYGLLQSRVNVIYSDDSLLWVSGATMNAWRTGLTAFNPEKNEFSYVESGLHRGFPDVDVNCLEADERSLYVGTPRGMYVIERSTWYAKGPVDRRRGLPDDNVLSMCRLGDSLFVGTASGLSMISLATDSVYQIRTNTFLNQIIYDLEAAGDDLWIAASTGAYRFSLKTGKLHQFNDPDLVLFSRVYDIEYFDNEVWFSSDGGVVSLDLETGETEPYREASRRLDSRALAVNEWAVAMASDDGMTMIFFDREKPYSREFTTSDGLPSDEVYSLLFDEEYIWIGTDRGLTRFLWDNPERVD